MNGKDIVIWLKLSLQITYTAQSGTTAQIGRYLGSLTRCRDTIQGGAAASRAVPVSAVQLLGYLCICQF